MPFLAFFKEANIIIYIQQPRRITLFCTIKMKSSLDWSDISFSIKEYDKAGKEYERFLLDEIRGTAAEQRLIGILGPTQSIL